MPWVCLQFVIVVVPDHTHLLFLTKRGYYFFEVNTKYISSKTSEFSLVRCTSENFDVFNSRDDINLVFTEKGKFSFYSIFTS